MPIATLPRPCLMLVTEPMERVRLVDVVREAVAGGVNVVQLRDKSLSRQELSETAIALRVCLGDCLLLVNGCPEAALEANASGVHLPENGSPVAEARSLVGVGQFVGCSVHSVATAALAEREGADYLVAGTVFASRSHPGLAPAGVGFVRSVCAAVRVPVLAIGGVTPENARQCLEAGASGVAVLSAILHADDPHAAARRYWERLVEVTGSSMELLVNGEVRTLEKSVSIAEFLAAHNLNPKRVVVEHNRAIVPRDRYAEALLQAGDEIEIVQMMAGG